MMFIFPLLQLHKLHPAFGGVYFCSCSAAAAEADGLLDHVGPEAAQQRGTCQPCLIRRSKAVALFESNTLVKKGSRCT